MPPPKVITQIRAAEGDSKQFSIASIGKRPNRTASSNAPFSCPPPRYTAPHLSSTSLTSNTPKNPLEHKNAHFARKPIKTKQRQNSKIALVIGSDFWTNYALLKFPSFYMPLAWSKHVHQLCGTKVCAHGQQNRDPLSPKLSHFKHRLTWPYNLPSHVHDGTHLLGAQKVGRKKKWENRPPAQTTQPKKFGRRLGEASGNPESKNDHFCRPPTHPSAPNRAPKHPFSASPSH